jgi:CRISPR-associated protein Csm4
MPMYRYSITPLTSFASVLQSDTLHGHLLWAAREWDGEQGVQKLIQDYEQGAPPFVCSSAMPRGMLPMPVLPPVPRARFASLSQELGFSTLFEALGSYKRFRKQPWLPASLWTRLRNDLDQEQLFRSWLEDGKRPEKDRQFTVPFETRKAIQPHNTIHRVSGTVLQGGLFFPEVTFHGPDATLDIYVETCDVTLFERLLQHVSQTGFGADRTTGKGHFSWCRDDNFDSTAYQGEGTHKMILSVFSARNLAAVKGSYKTFTKYGKVWNGYGERNPFKKPFLAFAEGSVFSEMPVDGYLLRDIHSDPNVVQVLWPVTLPFTLSRN